MTTTKQLNSNTHRRQANGGKTYAMTKSISDNTPVNQLSVGELRTLLMKDSMPKKRRKSNPVQFQSAAPVIVGGIEYSMSDMVSRPVAVEISNYHPHNFSELVTSGEISTNGKRGKQTRYLVADCARLAANKGKRKHNLKNAA